MRTIITSFVGVVVALALVQTVRAQGFPMSEGAIKKWHAWQPYDSAKQVKKDTKTEVRAIKTTDSLAQLVDTSAPAQFLSTDPYWERYRAWTPYHYASNNPVLLSDPTGDTVKYDQNMSIDERKAAMHFYTSSTTQTMRTQLETSQNTLTIGFRGSTAIRAIAPNEDRNYGGNVSLVAPVNARNASNGAGTDAYLALSISNFVNADKWGSQSSYYKEYTAIMGHELQHGVDYLYGTIMPGNAPWGTPWKEEQAMQYENQLRRRMGLTIVRSYFDPATGQTYPVRGIPQGSPVPIPQLYIGP